MLLSEPANYPKLGEARNYRPETRCARGDLSWQPWRVPELNLGFLTNQHTSWSVTRGPSIVAELLNPCSASQRVERSRVFSLRPDEEIQSVYQVFEADAVAKPAVS